MSEYLQGYFLGAFGVNFAWFLKSIGTVDMFLSLIMFIIIFSGYMTIWETRK